MKAVVGLMAAVVVAASTAGCASMQKESGFATSHIAPTSVVQDTAYVAKVEELAKRRGVGVVWVNPPKKRLPLVAVLP